jgi:hypothetical protein
MGHEAALPAGMIACGQALGRANLTGAQMSAHPGGLIATVVLHAKRSGLDMAGAIAHPSEGEARRLSGNRPMRLKKVWCG